MTIAVDLGRKATKPTTTLFLTISFACPCRPFGALVRFPCGGGGGGGAQQLQCKSESGQCSEKQQSPFEGEGGGGLKFEKNKCRKNNKVHT